MTMLFIYFCYRTFCYKNQLLFKNWVSDFCLITHLEKLCNSIVHPWYYETVQNVHKLLCVSYYFENKTGDKNNKVLINHLWGSYQYKFRMRVFLLLPLLSMAHTSSHHDRGFCDNRESLEVELQWSGSSSLGRIPSVRNNDPTVLLDMDRRRIIYFTNCSQSWSGRLGTRQRHTT